MGDIYYKENPRIVRGIKRCFADEQRRAEKAKKKENETEKEKKRENQGHGAKLWEESQVRERPVLRAANSTDQPPGRHKRGLRAAGSMKAGCSKNEKPPALSMDVYFTNLLQLYEEKYTIIC